MKKIGFIGLGNMGEAIINGLTQDYSKDEILGFDPNSQRCEKFSSQITIEASAQALVDNASIIVMAVKPNIIATALEGLTTRDEQIIVSIAAGVSIGKIESKLKSGSKVIRVMPNTPALVNEGMSVLALNSKVSENEATEVRSIFEKVGRTLILAEKYIDAVTGMSGCGPAYVFTFIQAMADGGVKMGLTRADAELLACQTLIGSAKMVLESGESPIALRNKVTSPGGSTIAGIHIFEQQGFSGTVMDAVEEATNVSSQLG